MRINSVEQKGYANRIMDWKIFVRQDLVVAVSFRINQG